MWFFYLIINEFMNHRLSERFRTFAESECKDSSPLYYTLSHSIAQDRSILAIAEQCSLGQPEPNLFFASIHYLLLSEKVSVHPLSEFYPTCSSSQTNLSEVYPHFRDFVRGHAEEIIVLLKSRLVQTNEVRRCAYRFPAFLFAASHFESRPLALIEIGTSAGLNLLWDKYRYSYGDNEIYGNLSSDVSVTSSFRGEVPSILSAPLPNISHRIGLDQNIVDTSIADQAVWLRALVWPEHHKRRSLMDAALKKRNEMTLDLRIGDGFAMLPGVAAKISEGSLLCVYHTHVANQISEEAREAFLRSIEELGEERDMIHIFNNIRPNLHLTAFRGGRTIDMPLANTDGHARWIEWLQK